MNRNKKNEFLLKSQKDLESRRLRNMQERERRKLGSYNLVII